MRVRTWLPGSVVVLLGLSGASWAADPPSFQKDVQPFLKRYCVQCHGERRPGSGVRLDSYEAMMQKSYRKAVVPGEPDESMMLLSLTGKGRRMPPRRSRAQPTSDEIEMIRQWIKAGARDDAADAAAPTPAPTPPAERKETPPPPQSQVLRLHLSPLPALLSEEPEGCPICCLASPGPVPKR